MLTRSPPTNFAAAMPRLAANAVTTARVLVQLTQGGAGRLVDAGGWDEGEQDREVRGNTERGHRVQL